MTSDPIMISEESVSLAWGKALKAACENQNRPLSVSIAGFSGNEPLENLEIRNVLDELFRRKKVVSVLETSETIFPYNRWRRSKESINSLSSWYLERYLPKHRGRCRRRKLIVKETYFERLIAFKGFKNQKKGLQDILINQLKKILFVYNHYKKIKNKPSPSKYIASLYNPSTDALNLSPYVPFPCLQQVGFVFSDGAVTVNGYYTIQFLMKRGYGNYLGLCRLGQFMAHETQLRFGRMNCFVANPRIDYPKRELDEVLAAINSYCD